MALNDVEIKKIKPSIDGKNKIIKDDNGLYLEVKPSGLRSWKFRYKYLNKDKKLTFGNYPLISLKEARIKRDEARKMLLDNIDPSRQKKQERQNLITSHQNNFKAIALEWLELRKNEVNNKTYKDTLVRLEKEIFPAIGNLPITEITPVMMIDVLKRIENRGVYETTRRVRRYVSRIFRFAIVYGKATTDPTRDIGMAFKTPKVENFKALPLEKLPELLDKIDENRHRLHRQTILGLKLMILTFTRKTELCHAKWSEIDFTTNCFIVPAIRTKMRKDHIVPLSKQALEILEELKNISGDREHIFPSIYKPLVPMCPDNILRALYRMGYKGEATIHGFRAFAMTAIIERLGYSREIADMQLAHSKGKGAVASYDRAKYLDDRIPMMQDWADFIDNQRKG